MILSHNNPFGFLQDLTPLRSVSLPHPYVWDAMRGGWTSYYTSSLVCILFSGSARWLNFHQNLAKFHLEMNSFTSQTTDESRLKSFRFFPQICPEMISKNFRVLNDTVHHAWHAPGQWLQRGSCDPSEIVIWSSLAIEAHWNVTQHIPTQNHLSILCRLRDPVKHW